MLFFSNNTIATENEATEETQGTGKMGILRNVAIIAGTAAGIGGVIFGAKKLHDHFSQDYLEDFDDDFDDFFEDEEVELYGQDGTTKPVNEETVEEESKTEETTNPLPAPFQDEKPESPNAARLETIKAAFETFKFDAEADNMVSVFEKWKKVDAASIDLYHLLQHEVISDDDRKAGEEIISNFSKEITNVIVCCEQILSAKKVKADTVSDIYWFLDQLRWTLSGVIDTETRNRLLAARNLASEIYSGPSEEEETVNEATSEETKKDSSEKVTVNKDDRDLDRLAVIDSELRTFQFTYPESLDSFLKKLDNIRQPMYDLVYMMKDSVVGLSDYSYGVADNIKENFNVELDKLVKACEKIVVSTGDRAGLTNMRDYLKKLNARTGFIMTPDVYSRLKNLQSLVVAKLDMKSSTSQENETMTDSESAGETQTAENCFDVFKREHKETNKVEGETKTSTEPLTYTMSEKVAEAVKTGDEIQAPVTTANASEKEAQEIMRIINDIPDRKTPENNDLPYITRCIGGHIAKIDTDDISSEILADLRNSVIVFTNMIDTAIEHLAADPNSDIYTLGIMNKIHDEFVASNTLSILGKDAANTMLEGIDAKISAFSEKIKSLKAETAATKEEVSEEPAETSSPNAEGVNELSAKLKHISTLVKSGKWSEAKTYYKNELVEYLADDHISEDLRLQIEAINTNITNHLMEEKQEANQQQTNNGKKKGNKNSKKSSRRYSKR